MTLSSSKKVKQNIAKLPDSPGVYIFRAKKREGKGEGKILYIGKATSLRDRVNSYMSRTVLDTRGPLIAKMLEEADSVDYIKTDSVLEALILEAHLIKKYQPVANVMQKDNKSFNFVVITKEDFPRVLIVRGHDLKNATFPRQDLGKRGFGENKLKLYSVLYSYGPFPNGGQLKEALKLVRKLFPFRDKCVPTDELKPSQNPKPCFNRQIGLCPGVCSGEISKEDYEKRIQNIVLFFEGKKKELLKSLEKEMKAKAKVKDFEGANKVKKTLFALNHIQDVSLIKDDFTSNKGLDSLDSFRIESYDIAHMAGQNAVGVMTVVEDGEIAKSVYRKFKIHPIREGTPGSPKFSNGVKDDNGRIINDIASLKQILERRLGHNEWKYPNLIVVDGGRAQKTAMESVLKKYSIKIPVVSVLKDDRHRPREILGDRKWLKYEKEIMLSNAEAHRYAISFHKQQRNLGYRIK